MSGRGRGARRGDVMNGGECRMSAAGWGQPGLLDPREQETFSRLAGKKVAASTVQAWNSWTCAVGNRDYRRTDRVDRWLSGAEQQVTMEGCGWRAVWFGGQRLLLGASCAPCVLDGSFIVSTPRSTPQLPWITSWRGTEWRGA